MKTNRVIIVGGGFGGVKSALRFANKPGVSVQLISNNTHFEYHQALYRSAVGYSPMEVVIPLKDIFSNIKNIQLVLDNIETIDPDKKYVLSSTGHTYRYDQIIFSLGSTTNYPEIDTLKAPVETMHDIASTIKLRKNLVQLFSQPHQGPVRVAIVGGGISGVELAGALRTFARLVAKKNMLTPPQLQVVIVESESRILPHLSAAASAKALKRLNTIDVEVHTGIRVESCQRGKLCMSAGDLAANTIVWTAGTKPSPFYLTNPEVFVLGRHGKVVVGDYLEAQGKKDIYVIGDSAETTYSGMAQTALYDADFVTKNLLRNYAGKSMYVYRSKKPRYFVAIGSGWALVESGRTINAGRRGWLATKRADSILFNNFQPYGQAIKAWRKASRLTV